MTVESPGPIRAYGMVFDVAGASAQGPRAENQDAFEVDAFAARGLVAVADGMGGERAGRLAADTALRALSAGDAAFRKKAAAKMKELMESARAMFLVSHALGSVKELCNRAIWLDKGRLMMEGTPDEVIKAYTKFLEVGEDAFSLEDL